MTVIDETVLTVLNKATGFPIDQLAFTAPVDLDRVLRTAADVQRDWARVSRHERYRLMTRYAAAVAEHTDEFAALLSIESGKPLAQCQGELGICERLFRGFAERMLAASERADFLDNQAGLEGDLLLTHREPLGVVVAILPFNFPIELFAHKVAPAIAMGNTVVVKPPLEDPLAVVQLVSLMTASGMPEGLVQVVVGGADVGAALVDSDVPAAISFTGSTETGKTVARTAARTLKLLTLELGGNDAMIVLPDADLDLVVEQAVLGRSIANGQCCCANKRIVVHESITEDLSTRLADRFGSLRVGDPALDGVEVGPLIHDRAASKVASQVEETLQAGARVLAGGHRADGNFFEPTVLAGVTPDMPVARDEEVFGPVMSILEARDDETAVEIANNSSYGLSGAIFSADVGRAMRVATHLQTGQVVINGTGLYRPDVAGFGGYGLSGQRREGLSESLTEYSQNKNIVLRRVLDSGRGAR